MQLRFVMAKSYGLLGNELASTFTTQNKVVLKTLGEVAQPVVQVALKTFDDVA
jgi:hypothetical protein